VKVREPHPSYREYKAVWEVNRAIIAGERKTKEYDYFSKKKLLLPFSPTMTIEQYLFFLSEAELPGICSEFLKTVVGGLLRKTPVLGLPENAPNGAYSWLTHEFGQDDSSLVSFLAHAIYEELQTGHAWLFVDYPQEDAETAKPYPIIRPAESIINWRASNQALELVTVHAVEASYEKDEFHPEMIDVYFVHDLDEAGFYRVRKFVENKEVALFEILVKGERLSYIPAFPLNGEIEIQEPFISNLVNKEIALYNKVSRRNHLLYGAATYTPIIYSDMSDEDFEQIVGGGLGTWIRLRQGDKADILKTPTDALSDMEKAIASNIEEIAKLGVRMLAPEREQSGVALQIRSASQLAQLGSLNSKISSTMSAVISFMLNWRYGTNYTPADIEFSLSQDFSPLPLGESWLRLATEWYKEGLIPRSSWLELLKKNDMLGSSYNDEEGRQEISENAELLSPKVNEDYARQFIDER
jgi:hypothetical protein